MMYLHILLLLPTIASQGIVYHLWKLGSNDGPTCLNDKLHMLQCVEPHVKLIDKTLDYFKESLYYSRITPESVIYNIGFVNKALQIGRNISECLGDGMECGGPKMVAYSLKHADYIGRKVYGDAFHCFINAETIKTATQCLEHGHIQIDYRRLFDESNYYNETTKALVECVAEKMKVTPSCTMDRMVSLYQGAQALFELYNRGGKWGMGEQVDLDYHPENYCDN
uniref:DUF19 domain-containing protein n=2 Tax=Caenorhabditis tropicalis TaxID=1561998 RepID=A0A1I7UGP7_9PELO